MRTVTFVRDEYDSEEIEIELDGETIIDCKEYEVDIWLGTLLEHLGIEFSEEERPLLEED